MRLRHLFVLAALAALLAGTWSGLIRMNWLWPSWRPGLLFAHGPLMVCGFLGTVIGLERCVALRRPWMFLAPLLATAGTAALLIGAGDNTVSLCFVASALFLVLIGVEILRLQTAVFQLIMAFGAILWLLGNTLWFFGRPLYLVVPWWMGFLILTIAGERLELNRLLKLPRRTVLIFLCALLCVIVGIVITLWNHALGMRVFGAGVLVAALWLSTYDIARYTVGKSGLTRFIAAALLLGYLWLAVGGALAVWYGGALVAGPAYDAVLHAVFVGFVFSMIFGHAPIVLGAVANKTVRYTPVFYSHLLLLHLSLVIRVAGDLLAFFPAREWGGLLNGAAILLFFVNTARAVTSCSRGGEA